MQQFPQIEGIDEDENPTLEDNAIVKIDLFKVSIGNPYNMIFTLDGLYNQNEPPVGGTPEFHNLFDGTEYQYRTGYISTKTVPNNETSTSKDIYIICSEDNDIYYWDGVSTHCKRLEGTFVPPTWQTNTTYHRGDIVVPPTENGYAYVCMSTQGRSGSSQPSWALNLSTQFSDGGVSWKGVSSYGLEGVGVHNMTAKFVEHYKGFTFVANTKEGGTVYPSRLRWSQWQNPRLWHNNDDGSGMSGYVDVDDVEGEIVSIKKINDILVVYKEKGIVAVTFTGGDTVFSKEVITTKTGLLSSNAIIELPHSHIFIGEDNIYEFDGSSVTPIGDPIKDFFFDTLNPLYRTKIIGYYDRSVGDIIFIYDKVVLDEIVGIQEEELARELNSKKNRNVAITFNISTKTWAKREMYVTAIGEFCQTENRIIDSIDIPIDEYNEQIDSSYGLKDKIITICGDELGNIFRFLGQKDERRNTYYGYVTSKTHHMEDPGHIKRLMRIQFHIQTTRDCTLVVDVGTSWNSETQMEKWETHNLQLKSPKPPFVDVDLSARYFQIRFGTKNNGEYFKVLGYTLYYQTRGDE